MLCENLKRVPINPHKLPGPEDRQEMGMRQQVMREREETQMRLHMPFSEPRSRKPRRHGVARQDAWTRRLDRDHLVD